MSVHVTSWVWRNAPVAGNELLVLLALADISNDDGISWPSNGLLAEKTRLSLATVKRMKQRLRERRLLVDDTSLGRSNVYRIVMDGVAQVEPLRAQVEPVAQIEPAHSSEPGVAHSSEPGGGSRLSHYTSENRNEPSGGDVFELDVPSGSRSAVAFPRPFMLLAEDRAWAAATVPSVAVDVVTADFVAYWREGEGRGKRKKNWRLTWRNWLKREHERNVARGWKPVEMEERKVIRSGRVVG